MFRTISRFAVAAILIMTFLSAPALRADEMDDQYLRILNTVDQAEAYEKAGKIEQAKASYQAAQKSLLEIKKADPTWKPTMVAHRLTDVSGKLAGLTAPAAADKEVATTKTTTTTEAAAQVVKLIEAGAAPRRTVRLQPKAGDQQKLEMTMNMSMEMTMAGAQVPAVNIPAIKLPMDVRVETVSADGEINYKSTMGEANVGSASGDTPGVGEAMQSIFGGLKGLSASGVMSSRGVIKSVDVKVPADASPQLRQSLDQMKDSLSAMSAPFPEEPIGVGAKWEFKQVLKSQGMTIKQTSQYELLSLDGERAEVKLTILQSAASQKIASPMMPGMKMDLEKFEGAGMGKATYDLTRLLPIASEIASGSDIKMGMNVGGQKQAMEMKATTKVRLESK